MKEVLKIMLFILLGAAALFLFIRWFERANLYFPMRRIEIEPSQAGMEFEEHYYRTSDGQKIHAWYVPARESVGLTLVFCHGNAGNISHRLEKIAMFNEAGLDVLIFDYRGYGRSTGRPTEKGTYADARGAIEFLKREKALTTQDMVFYGESLGGAVAARMAAEFSPAGVIIDSTFTSVADMAREIFPFLPANLIVTMRYDTLEAAGRITSPVLVAHSREDEIVPFSHGRRIYERVEAPKIFCELYGGHNEITRRKYRDFGDCLDRFFEMIK